MTALEIVLTSVLGALIIVVGLYLFLLNTNVENRLQLFEVINEDAKENGIVFFGDSLTDFFPIQDFFPDKTIYNRGIAGDKTRDLLKRLDDIIILKPRKIFIQIGTNDLGKRIKINKIIHNIENIISTFKEKIPNTEIIIISLYPVSHHKMWLSPFIAGRRSNKKIKAVNEELKVVATTHNLKYINMFPLLVDEKGRLDARYTLEGLHISGLGYGVIAKELQKHLD